MMMLLFPWEVSRFRGTSPVHLLPVRPLGSRTPGDSVTAFQYWDRIRPERVDSAHLTPTRRPRLRCPVPWISLFLF